jgi:DNA polymerase III subunit epsilon
MREIVMDTETTGLNPNGGDRLVEIAGIELHNYLPTGRVYHEYVNPERDMPREAFAVHGLSAQFLSTKSVFASVAASFLEFIGDATLVFHNASFDMGFINMELGRLDLPPIPPQRIVDTLALARRKHPGGPNSLDALCKRYGIDNSTRTKHGALLDSELLAEVYLQLVGGQQPVFDLSPQRAKSAATEGTTDTNVAHVRPQPLLPMIQPAELEAHTAFVATLKEPLWRLYEEKND